MSIDQQCLEIAQACILAKHATVWNQWMKLDVPELCDACDNKIGELQGE